jgi:hypothetical protein
MPLCFTEPTEILRPAKSAGHKDEKPLCIELRRVSLNHSDSGSYRISRETKSPEPELLDL